jgi:hypothetical protein
MSICDPALRNALRTLKLSGMLDTLDARLAQTRDGDLGHLEFLQALCEDEIARRESAALTRPGGPDSRPILRALLVACISATPRRVRLPWITNAWATIGHMSYNL